MVRQSLAAQDAASGIAKSQRALAEEAAGVRNALDA